MFLSSSGWNQSKLLSLGGEMIGVCQFPQRRLHFGGVGGLMMVGKGAVFILRTSSVTLGSLDQDSGLGGH